MTTPNPIRPQSLSINLPAPAAGTSYIPLTEEETSGEESLTLTGLQSYHINPPLAGNQPAKTSGPAQVVFHTPYVVKKENGVVTYVQDGTEKLYRDRKTGKPVSPREPELMDRAYLQGTGAEHLGSEIQVAFESYYGPEKGKKEFSRRCWTIGNLISFYREIKESKDSAFKIAFSPLLSEIEGTLRKIQGNALGAPYGYSGNVYTAMARFQVMPSSFLVPGYDNANAHPGNVDRSFANSIFWNIQYGLAGAEDTEKTDKTKKNKKKGVSPTRLFYAKDFFDSIKNGKEIKEGLAALLKEKGLEHKMNEPWSAQRFVKALGLILKDPKLAKKHSKLVEKMENTLQHLLTETLPEANGMRATPAQEYSTDAFFGSIQNGAEIRQGLAALLKEKGLGHKMNEPWSAQKFVKALGLILKDSKLAEKHSKLVEKMEETLQQLVAEKLPDDAARPSPSSVPQDTNKFFAALPEGEKLKREIEQILKDKNVPEKMNEAWNTEKLVNLYNLIMKDSKTKEKYKALLPKMQIALFHILVEEKKLEVKNDGQSSATAKKITDALRVGDFDRVSFKAIVIDTIEELATPKGDYKPLLDNDEFDLDVIRYDPRFLALHALKGEEASHMNPHFVKTKGEIPDTLLGWKTGAKGGYNKLGFLLVFEFINRDTELALRLGNVSIAYNRRNDLLKIM
jgi:hypothetical protein